MCPSASTPSAHRHRSGPLRTMRDAWDTRHWFPSLNTFADDRAVLRERWRWILGLRAESSLVRPGP